MRVLIQFLVEHPILLMVLVAWIAGLVGQIGKAKKARERAQSHTPDAAPEVDEAELAREMRRILRQPEPERAEPRPEPPEPPRRRPVVVEERAPQPMVTTTAARRLPIHGAPHVGEAIALRAQRQRSRVGEHARGTELGSLGGRVHQGPTRRSEAHRYALDDLKRAFVLSEILGPPLALRPDRQV